ncbi:MAG TPA: protein kinase [Anaeromyxobacteraceae bacterium]|nr:protein kinase [Anaeromyxobacteraceae bacterium]
MQRPGSIIDLDVNARCPRCGGDHPSDAACLARTEPSTLAFGAPPGAEEASTRDPLVGATVGSFRIVRMLGRGGMGTVYLGEHPAIGSRVAIKFLHDAMSADREVVRRFYDEARAANLIGHENIVAIYDLNVVPPGRYYFVMEYLEGEPLTARIAQGRLDPAAALEILLQLCDALQCAHEHGVVHRDLKPDNVFLVVRRGNRDFVKLLDFGIAKLRDAAGGSRRTAAGLVVGTPEYMAPEQCDVGPVDARTDVYALGVIAYELLTGRLPFVARTVPQLLLAHLQQRPPPLAEVAPGIDPRLEWAVLKALEKDPKDRFQDMTGFADALGPALERARRGRSAGPAIVPAQPDAPAPPIAAPAPSEAARPVVEVRIGAGAPRQLQLAELTRAGAFLRAEADLPPLLSRLELSLFHPVLSAPVLLPAEVVRHVSPAEASAWRMKPGFAVQFLDLAPEARAAVAAVLDARGGPQRATPPPSAGGEERLREVEARAGGLHYAFLGVPPDAEFSEIRRAAKSLRAELEGLAARPDAPDHPARATRLLARLDAAAQALGSPAERLRHDGERGNWRGVQRCLAAGLPAPLVEARRRELLKAHPDRAAEAQRQLARAQVARKLGNGEAAVAAYEAALAADPLDAATLEGYVAYRRELGR